MTATARWALPMMAALATGMRPDWDLPAITEALDALYQASWPPGKANLCLAQAIADPKGSPADLLAAAQATTGRPMAGRPPAAPHTVRAIRDHYGPGAAGTTAETLEVSP